MTFAEALATKAGYGEHSSISRIENGDRHPSRKSTNDLGNALGLTGRALDAFVMLAGYVPDHPAYRKKAMAMLREEAGL